MKSHDKVEMGDDESIALTLAEYNKTVIFCMRIYELVKTLHQRRLIRLTIGLLHTRPIRSVMQMMLWSATISYGNSK
jgi:hypothetical protein